MANEELLAVQLTTKEAAETIYGDWIDMLDYKEMVAMFNCENVSGTTVTLDVTLQHCHNNDTTDADGDSETLHAFTQVTDGTGPGRQLKVVPDGSDDGFMRYVRAKSVITGASPVFTYEVIVIGKE